MSYAELMGYMRQFRRGRICRLEMIAAITLWQCGGARA
jgi:hypothetical protein